MRDVYISLRHTPLSTYYAGWFDKIFGSDGVRVYKGFTQPRQGDFPKELSKTVESCRNFILILTPDTFGQEDDNTSWMAYEVETAIKAKANIIPVVTSDFVWPEELPDRLNGIREYKETIVKACRGLSSDYEYIVTALEEIHNRLIPNEKEDIFISYSSKESAIAEKIKEKLERNGIGCWMAPQSIAPGSDYGTEIYKAIKNCKIFLLLLSANSQKSPWVPKELGLAINEGLRIIPFHIDDSDINESFKFHLVNCQMITADKRIDTASFELVDIISDILNS